jgi:hypothetical protein
MVFMAGQFCALTTHRRFSMIDRRAAMKKLRAVTSRCDCGI